MEKAMAAHSSTLAWKIPWTEEPSRRQSVGSHRVGHDWSDLAAAAAARFKLQGQLSGNCWFLITPWASTWWMAVYERFGHSARFSSGLSTQDSLFMIVYTVFSSQIYGVWVSHIAEKAVGLSLTRGMGCHVFGFPLCVWPSEIEHGRQYLFLKKHVFFSNYLLTNTKKG